MMDLVDAISALAGAVDQYGPVLIFTIISVMFNAWVVIALARGRLIPHRLYKQTADELEKLHDTMEKERSLYMSRLLSFMGNLKATSEEGDHDGNRSNQ